MTFDDYVNTYKKYFRLARKIANDFLKDYYLAGDVAQEVFIELYQKLEGLNTTQIKSWIVLNIYRRSCDQSRKAYHRHEVQLPQKNWSMLEPLSPLETEELTLQQEQTLYRYSALEALKAHNQYWYDILIRLHVNNESYESLSRAYGIKTATLRMHVHRARKYLNRIFGELYRDN